MQCISNDIIGNPTPITQVKVGTLAKSRVSIETRELRLSSRECDFPGINIPTQGCHLGFFRFFNTKNAPKYQISYLATQMEHD